MEEAAEALYRRAEKLAGNYRESNVSRILALLEEAAEFDHPDALFGLGTWYHHGIGVARDDVRAFGFWERAAAAGHLEALFFVAMACERGAGTPCDLPRAFAAYEACVARGYVNAVYETGRCRYYGIGTPLDRAAAENDFLAARRFGQAEATADAAESDGPRRMPRPAW